MTFSVYTSLPVGLDKKTSPGEKREILALMAVTLQLKVKSNCAAPELNDYSIKNYT